jgi:hypothetical protein
MLAAMDKSVNWLTLVIRNKPFALLASTFVMSDNRCIGRAGDSQVPSSRGGRSLSDLSFHYRAVIVLMVDLIVSDGSIGKDISRWETPEEWRRGFNRALIRRRTRPPLD